MWKTGIRGRGYEDDGLLDDKWYSVYERDVHHSNHFIYACSILRDYWHNHDHRQR